MKNIKADVAIVAAGPAGLCAAVAAAEKGVSVVVFEKSGAAGGTANMGMGPFGVESRIQQNSMVELTKEEAFARFMDYVHWQADARLIHDYLWKSGSTIDWLEDMGVVFAGVMKNFPASEQTWHVVQPEDGGRPGARSAGAMNKVIFNRAVELGVQFYFNTPVYELIKTGDAVTGCRAKGDDGEEYEVEAKAVIIATGGFGTNPEMVKEYTGYTLGENMFDFMVPGIVGDGIKMAWAVGAGKSRMEMERTEGQPLPGADLGQWPQTMLFSQASPICINKSGYRICNEEVAQNASIYGNIIDFQQDKTAYRILDEGMVKYYRKKGLDYPCEVFHEDPTENFEEVWEQLAKDYPDICYVAETPADLAEQIGIPVENLEETIETYNGFCDDNYDDDFGKKRKYLKLLTKKLYAYRMSCGGYGSLGGIKIDHKLRVITDDYKVIPGLYGAGTDVNDIYNGTYYYYFPGNTMGFAINTGRMAGEYAADYVSE